MLAMGFAKPHQKGGYSRLNSPPSHRVRIHVAYTASGYAMWRFCTDEQTDGRGDFVFSRYRTWADVVAAITAAKLTS